MINQKVKETLTLTSKQNQDHWREDSNSRFGPRSGSKPDDKRSAVNNDQQNHSKKTKIKMGKRFHMTKKDRINSWSLKVSLTKYALSQMNCFIPDSDIKEQILQEFPISDNLTCKKKDGFEYEIPSIREESQINFVIR